MSAEVSLYPDRANGASFSLEFQSDVDAQAESLEAFDQRYIQIEAGPFKGSMATCDFGTGLVVSFETISRRMMQLGSIPNDSVQVAMIMAGKDASHLNCTELETHSAILLRPGSEAVLHAGRDMQVCLLSVTGAAIENLRERFEFEPEMIGGDVILPAHQTTSLRGLVSEAYDRFTANHGPETVSPREIKSFQNALLGTIAWSFGEPHAGLIGENSTPGRHSQIFARALHLVDRNLAENITPDWMAKELGVSRRSLDTIMGSAVGSSPANFIKLQRLNRLRAMLRDPSCSGDPIGDLAARCGIWHLGRMAGEYRDHFGVLPSQDRAS